MELVGAVLELAEDRVLPVWRLEHAAISAHMFGAVAVFANSWMGLGTGRIGAAGAFG